MIDCNIAHREKLPPEITLTPLRSILVIKKGACIKYFVEPSLEVAIPSVSINVLNQGAEEVNTL